LAAAIDILKAATPTKKLRRVAEQAPEAFVKFASGLQRLAAELEDKPGDAGFVPRPWQREVLEMLALPADDRTIVWVFDAVGGKGKSRLVRHLVCEFGAVQLEGRLADMCYAYNKERIVCFDVSRSQGENVQHLYSMAEKLKSGQFMSSKYCSVLKVFTPPHVVFFSNQDWNREWFSHDRVKMVEL
jgi:hypothetical protein